MQRNKIHKNYPSCWVFCRPVRMINYICDERDGSATFMHRTLCPLIPYVSFPILCKHIHVAYGWKWHRSEVEKVEFLCLPFILPFRKRETPCSRIFVSFVSKREIWFVGLGSMFCNKHSHFPQATAQECLVLRRSMCVLYAWIELEGFAILVVARPWRKIRKGEFCSV
jgi:hypothetical protein